MIFSDQGHLEICFNYTYNVYAQLVWLICVTSILLSSLKGPILEGQIKTFIVVVTWYLVEWWIYRNRIRLVRMRKFQKLNHITIAYFHTFKLLQHLNHLSAMKRITSTRKSTVEKMKRASNVERLTFCFLIP